MRIAFSVEGGLASFPGLRRPVTLDSASLPPAQAARLADLVTRARFFDAAPPAKDAAGADRRTYVVEIDDGRQCRTLALSEPIEDPALRALVGEIRDCARAARGG